MATKITTTAGYEMTARYQEAGWVVVTDSNGVTGSVTNEKWAAMVAHHKANGATVE